MGVWRQERPILDVHFIGLAVCDTTFMAPLSPPVDAARAEIVGEFREMVNGEQ